jgi:hypothetical protein
LRVLIALKNSSRRPLIGRSGYRLAAGLGCSRARIVRVGGAAAGCRGGLVAGQTGGYLMFRRRRRAGAGPGAGADQRAWRRLVTWPGTGRLPPGSQRWSGFPLLAHRRSRAAACGVVTGCWAGWVMAPQCGWVTGRGRAGEGGGCRERTGPAGSGDERVP